MEKKTLSVVQSFFGETVRLYCGRDATLVLFGLRKDLLLEESDR